MKGAVDMQFAPHCLKFCFHNEIGSYLSGYANSDKATNTIITPYESAPINVITQQYGNMNTRLNTTGYLKEKKKMI